MKRVTVLSPVVGFLLSLLFVANPLAAAQGTATSLPGITVLGMGQASVPAETATIVLMLGSGDYSYEDPVMKEPLPAATPAAPADELVAPVILALVAAGVPEADIQVISNPFMGGYAPYPGPTMVTLVFTLDDPTSEGISDILFAAIDAATAEGMYVNMTSALYGVEDCAALHREARANAIADAREKGTVQAELLDVSLGDVVASQDDTYGAVAYSGMYGGVTQYNSCSIGGGLEPTSIMYSAPAFDPGIEPVVTVSAYIELTFAIEPAAP